MKTTTPPDVSPTGPVPHLLRIRLGMSLQKYRLAANLTQAEVAKRANLSLKYVGEVERGEANTTVDVIERIAAVVNWDPLETFEGLREPISEGVRVFLIEFLEEFVQGLQQAIRWLQALDPMRNRSSRNDAIAVAVSGSEPGNTNRPRGGIARRLLGRK